VRGVCRHVATFVVSVDAEIELHQPLEALVGVARPVAEVVGQADIGVDLEDFVALPLVGVVDERAQGKRLRNQIQTVFQHLLPEHLLVHTLAVGFSEFAVFLEQQHASRKFGHGVERLGHARDEVGGFVVQLHARPEVCDELLLLRGVGQTAGQQQPEDVFGFCFPIAVGRAQLVDCVVKSQPAESDALLLVQFGQVPEHAVETAHATQH